MNFYSAAQKIIKEKPLKTIFIYVALICITFYDLQSIFNFFATDIPSNNTEAWILKFCFLVVFFFSLKFNDRNVKMINLWENCCFFFFLCILQTQWACLDFDFLLLTGTGFSSLSSSGSGHKPPFPSLHHYSHVPTSHKESRPSPNQQIPCHCQQ